MILRLVGVGAAVLFSAWLSAWGYIYYKEVFLKEVVVINGFEVGHIPDLNESSRVEFLDYVASGFDALQSEFYFERGRGSERSWLNLYYSGGNRGEFREFRENEDDGFCDSDLKFAMFEYMVSDFSVRLPKSDKHEVEQVSSCSLPYDFVRESYVYCIACE